MMDKLISLQMAIDALCKSECGWSNAECRHKDDTDFFVTCDNVKIIKSLPSIQTERKTGQWITHLYKLGKDRYECDSCHKRCDTEYCYCPNCGADMRGDKHEID